MDEFFDVFDESGNYIGKYPRSQCHGDPKLIHRSVHVVVFDRSMQKILLQKRSMNKDIQPGKWDTAVGGHVASGESVSEAAVRELSEELGIAGELEFFFESKIRNQIESENVTVFKLINDGPFDFQHEEIDEVRFFDLAEFAAPDGGSRDDFTPNLQLELKKIISLLNL